ncbi:MAG TPA: class I SAM-dependent methyltransferase, partial [Gammaproteobacteria bacterium]|nr:class I SAM-dependent methyltransferase [Gammaproteobacteria bacterium]
MPKLNSYFWNFVAKKYERDPIADLDSYQKKLEMTRQYMHPDMEIAEIGCGTGTTAIAHAPFVKHIDAFDISTNMLKIAQEKAKAQNIENITFTRAKAEEIVVDSANYDMVMTHSVLHLLNDKEMVIADIFSMLKPGGHFVSSTICLANNGAIGVMRFLLPIGNFLGLLPLVRFFDEGKLLSSITGAGFEIEQQWQPKKD